MHVPDHLLDTQTILSASALAATSVAIVIAARPRTRTYPRIGTISGTAALVFGAQMINFPILPTTSGHFIGATLAAALLGPRIALIVMAIVLSTQALLFGDGGISAIGVNVLLMAVIPIGIFALIQNAAIRLTKRSRLRTSTAVSALLSVPISALFFALIHTVGGTSDVAPMGFAISLVSLHLIIGVAESIISLVVLSLVMAVAPDVVTETASATATRRTRRAGWALWAGAIVCAAVLSSLAFNAPDGLESALTAFGLAGDSPIFSGVPQLSGYGDAAGTPLPLVGLIGAGTAGILAALLAGRIGSRRRTQS